jgi:hypothetical protein
MLIFPVALNAEDVAKVIEYKLDNVSDYFDSKLMEKSDIELKKSNAFTISRNEGLKISWFFWDGKKNKPTYLIIETDNDSETFYFWYSNLFILDFTDPDATYKAKTIVELGFNSQSTKNQGHYVPTLYQASGYRRHFMLRDLSGQFTANTIKVVSLDGNLMSSVSQLDGATDQIDLKRHYSQTEFSNFLVSLQKNCDYFSIIAIEYLAKNP